MAGKYSAGEPTYDNLSELLNSCWNCARPREDHPNGQCLFQSTTYLNYGEALDRGIKRVLSGELVIPESTEKP